MDMLKGGPRREAQYGEIRRIVGARRPAFLGVVDRLEPGPVTDDEVDEVQDALLDELLESGLDAAGEADKYGWQVEDLIDLANHARPEFRAPSSSAEDREP